MEKKSSREEFVCRKQSVQRQFSREHRNRRTEQNPTFATLEEFEAAFPSVYEYIRAHAKRICGRRNRLWLVDDLIGYSALRAYRFYAQIPVARGQSTYINGLVWRAFIDMVDKEQACSIIDVNEADNETIRKDPMRFVARVEAIAGEARRTSQDVIIDTRDVLAGLPASMKLGLDVLTLHTFESLQLEETAQMLGVSVDKAKYAKRKTIEYIRKNCPDLRDHWLRSA